MNKSEIIKQKLKGAYKNSFEFEPPHPPIYNELVSTIGKSNFNKLFELYGDLDLWYGDVVGYTTVLLKHNEVNWNNKVLVKTKKDTTREIKNTQKTIKKFPSVKKYFNSYLVWWKKIQILINLLVKYKNEFERSKVSKGRTKEVY